MRIRQHLLLGAAGAFAAVASMLSGCSGGGNAAAPAPLAVATPAALTLAAATSTFCLTPGTAAQSVAIPDTGGFTGTLSIAAAASAAASCDVSVAVASGGDVVSPAGVTASSSTRRTASTNPSTGPIFDMSMSNAFANNVEITGATLNTPPGLVFPDGTYSALVVSGTLPPTVLTFTAKNGVLVLTSTGLPIIVAPGTTATLYLYAQGVVPTDANGPTPSPVPSASASAGATASPAASAPPTAAPTASPVPSPVPSTGSTAYTATITVSPSNCIAFGNAGGTQTYTAAISTNAPAGTQLYYIWSNPVQQPFTYTFPTAPVSIGIGLNGAIATTSNSVTITVPPFPEGTLAGSSGSFQVTGAYYDADPHVQETIIFSNPSAYANVVIAAGIATCPT